MPKHSKRFAALAKMVEPAKVYSVEEAVALIKQTATTKFDSSVEVHIRLGIDPKKGEQQIRGTIVLPFGIGKSKRVAVFTTDDKIADAKAAGADVVGGLDLIDEIKKSGKVDFDIAVATPDIMKDMAAVARILGPKGMMPSPKNETITTNVKKTVEELKKGKIAFKNDDTANIHQLIGKASFAPDQLAANYRTFIDAVAKVKPESMKGVYIKKVVMCSAMGPGLQVALQ
jgi:large subunit ribosomal protein L1